MEKMGEIILNSRITKEFDCIHINSSNNQSSNAERGHLSWTNIKSTLRISLAISLALIRNRIQIANIPLACNKFGFIKYILQVLPCFIFRAKVVSRLGGSHFDKFYKTQPLFYQFIICQILKRIDCIIVRGKEQHKQFQGIYNGRYECVYIPSTVIKYSEQNNDLKSDTKEQFHILFLGMVSQAKGAYDLIRAIPQVLAADSNFVFHFVGDLVEPQNETNITFLKSESFNIKKFIKENKLEQYVTFYGPLYGDAKIQQLKKVDLFICPSYSESGPFTVVEAMENGLPVVATKVGFLPELFDHGKNIIYVDFNSPSQIKEAILKLRNNQELCRTMVNNNYKILETELSIKTYEKQMIRIFDSL